MFLVVMLVIFLLTHVIKEEQVGNNFYCSYCGRVNLVPNSFITINSQDEGLKDFCKKREYITMDEILKEYYKISGDRVARVRIGKLLHMLGYQKHQKQSGKRFYRLPSNFDSY